MIYTGYEDYYKYYVDIVNSKLYCVQYGHVMLHPVKIWFSYQKNVAMYHQHGAAEVLATYDKEAWFARFHDRVTMVSVKPTSNR